MKETVQRQIADHLDGLEAGIRDLRAKLLPLPPSKMVWELGTICRLAGSRFIALTREVEELEKEAVLNPPATPVAEVRELF